MCFCFCFFVFLLMTPAKLSRYTGKVIMILVPEQTQRVFVIFGFERLMFLPNDDRSIDNGLASHLCLDISRIQEHKTAAILWRVFRVKIKN